MKQLFSRGRFLAIAGGSAMFGLAPSVKAGRFASRYQFAFEMVSGYNFLVDPPVNPLNPHPSIVDQVRSGALRQRERVEFPYGDSDTMRSLAYFEDPAKPFSADNIVPSGDPRIIIEILTDVTSILVRDDPFPHFTVMGLVVENPTSTFFGNLTSRVMIFSAAIDTQNASGLVLAVSSTSSSHVLGARGASGTLAIAEGGLR